MGTRRKLTAITLSLACIGVVAACGAATTASNEQLASAARLTLSATAEPDTITLEGELTLTLRAENALPVGILAPGPCPSVPLRMQIVGADSLRGYTIVGAGVGCKALNGPATVRLEPGWTAASASRGRAGAILSPGLRPGSYRLRGVYEAPTDTARGPWMSIVVLP